MVGSLDEEILRIRLIDSANEKLSELLKAFHHHFPCQLVHLFRYSIFDQRIDGIFSCDQGMIKAIPQWHDDARTIPFLYDALQLKKVVHLEGESFQIRLSSKYTLNEPVENMIVLPIIVNDVIVAFICAINTNFEFNNEMSRYLQGFGEQMKQLLHVEQVPSASRAVTLSEKELRVMQYTANGFTTKEIASFLNIAESTVKYFINNVMTKTSSRNRTEAVANLYRASLLI
ncbi:LuxR C-terminal-related transcriptional regulator [Paenibacillus sp. NPDC058071]|uniref:LuxR C-terminal-related transcriptional regulator n=1 Tax=Paenibacillus sp. NPDC058071 TaxID=3346326 RepID=UPI0036D78C4D